MTRASTLSAKMRRVRGDLSPRLRTSGSVPMSRSNVRRPELSVFSVMARFPTPYLYTYGKGPERSVGIVAVSDAIEGLDLSEILVYAVEFPAQPLDVAVDGPVVYTDVFAIGCVHQLIPSFYMAGT